MMTYEEQQLEALQEAYSDLERENRSLQYIIDENDGIYDDLLIEHKDLQAEHAELKAEYASLFEEFQEVLDILDGNSNYEANKDVDEEFLEFYSDEFPIIH